MAQYFSPKTVTSGLVLYVDAGNLKSYRGSGTSFSDMSGAANNGTLTNGPTFSSTSGGAIVFDGVDDYVDLGTGSGTLDQLSNVITIQAMINTAYPTNRMTIYSTGYTGQGIMFGTSANTPGGLEVYYPSWYVAYTAGSLLTANTWYHVAYTRSGTGSGTHKFYVNGVSQALSSDTSANFSAISTTKYIGYRSGVMYNGSIACLSVYNRPLAPDEILQNFNAIRGRFNI